jgi:hypothetical protein
MDRRVRLERNVAVRINGAVGVIGVDDDIGDRELGAQVRVIEDISADIGVDALLNLNAAGIEQQRSDRALRRAKIGKAG